MIRRRKKIFIGGSDTTLINPFLIDTYLYYDRQEYNRYVLGYWFTLILGNSEQCDYQIPDKTNHHEV
jgi:hypothetical protein